MGETTGISWCDHTWNPVIGCTRVSPACDGCYAAALMGTDGRLKVAEWGEPGKGAGTRVRTTPSTFNAPLKWNRKAERDGVIRFVFLASLSDWADNEWPIEWLRDTFGIIYRTPWLRYLMLTKRPQLIVKRFREAMGPDAVWPSNAFAGTTTEDQPRADQNIPAVLRAKAALGIPLVFLSMEPLLEGVNIRPWLRELCPHCLRPDCVPSLRSDSAEVFSVCGRFVMETPEPAIGWVITGGETDQGAHKARPTNPDWLRPIRDACAAAGVPYHHKQNGEWAGQGQLRVGDVPPGALKLTAEIWRWPDRSESLKVGKRYTGRLLDGVLHDAMPVLP